ncbi:MAG TPA: PAS domain-containing sensor histidine kinase [Alphaproteobacteria bacterium]|nr:PAS domain-containing sensor histidine kinase [Alphaproteobacteria bacterium]
MMDKADIDLGRKNISTTTLKFLPWIRSFDIERKLALFLITIGLPIVAVTFFIIQGAISAEISPSTILWFLTIDLVILLLLMLLISKRVFALWMQRRKGIAGTKLHTRIVFWFSFLAVIPSIIVTIFTTLFLNLGLNQWFSDSVQEAVKNSLIVAQGYLQEHQQSILGDILSMENDLKKEGPIFQANPQRIQNFILLQSALRSLSEVLILDGKGKVLAAGNFSLTAALNPGVSPSSFERARLGDTIILSSPTEDRVRAITLVDPENDIFLYVGRRVDANILAYVDETSKAVDFYERMEGRRSQIQITFALIFIVIASLTLMCAIWIALAFSDRLFKPVAQLITAAVKIGQGDLNIRVSTHQGSDEINLLGQNFNRMIEQVSRQQQELITKNMELNDRRQFTEIILQGISAGVMGVDDQGYITMANQSAIALLNLDQHSLVGIHFLSIFPEIDDLFKAIQSNKLDAIQGKLEIDREDNKRTLITKLVRNQTNVHNHGFVVTFDDISGLLNAQRKAAWSDVARRIAHEVKNPLTPIQLAAERLKRRYQKSITNDLEIFDQCIDTIINQVDTIKKLVDEFSAFARMPTAIFQTDNIVSICKQAIFLQSQAHPQIIFETNFTSNQVFMKVDNRQMGQAITNILLNSVQAIEKQQETNLGFDGCIKLELMEDKDIISVTVTDNGGGFPEKYIPQIGQPYITTKTNGSGLGLAIVKKIVEDHSGELIFGNAEGRKAFVTFKFNKQLNSLLS